jgi:archaetidylinositol phosphate synthase
MQDQAKQMHVRENESLLAVPEKRVLHCLATHMPGWVNSDQLTLLGLLAMMGAGVAYWVARYDRRALLLVVLALAVNWFGDSLDGTLARVRNRQRPRYGFYVDHVVDLVGTFFLLGGLALSGFMTPLLALGMLAAFLMVEAEVYLATHVRGVFKMTFMKFGPTELRVLLSIGTLYLLHDPTVGLGGAGRFLMFDVGGMIATLGMALAMAVSSIRNTRALYKAEPLPR